MKKTLIAALAAALSAAALAGTALQDLSTVPAEAFYPANATFVEGEDDGTGGIDFKVASDASVADLAKEIQAKAAEMGWTEKEADIQEEDAKLEYAKMNAEGDAPEYTVDYTIVTEDGKRHVEVIFLDAREKK
ncbi:MAG: hypothetical protein Q4D61_08445 [Cardiobacteriaceae bacterium]|nr:hypothetical protein [Cardiobacteriaceae bacterium]